METKSELGVAVELTAAWLMLYPHSNGPARRSGRVLVRRERFLAAYCRDTARIDQWNHSANRQTGGF